MATTLAWPRTLASLCASSGSSPSTPAVSLSASAPQTRYWRRYSTGPHASGHLQCMYHTQPLLSSQSDLEKVPPGSGCRRRAKHLAPRPFARARRDGTCTTCSHDGRAEMRQQHPVPKQSSRLLIAGPEDTNIAHDRAQPGARVALATWKLSSTPNNPIHRTPAEWTQRWVSAHKTQVGKFLHPL